MRILFTSNPLWGHVTPMLPLARALNDAGADVVWATAEPAAQRLRDAGVPARAAGSPDRPTPTVLARHPEIAALAPRDRPDHLFAKVFGPDRCGPMLTDLLPLMDEVRPHLVVGDITELAAPIAAALRRVPCVTHSLGALFPRTRLERAAVEVAQLWEAHGLAARPFRGTFDELYLDIYPPSLQEQDRPHVPHTQRLRSVPPASAPGTLHPFPEAGDRPIVYVTFGTVFNEAAPLRHVVERVRDLDVFVVVTVGPDGDPAVLGPQPANVHVAPFIRQEDLLPHCAAVVSHAGSGTFLGAVAHGLPQVCVPQGADQFLNADACTRAGAGLSVDGAPASVRDALRRVLTEPGFGAAARVVQDELAAMPRPDEVAALLVDRYGSAPSRERDRPSLADPGLAGHRPCDEWPSAPRSVV